MRVCGASRAAFLVTRPSYRRESRQWLSSAALQESWRFKKSHVKSKSVTFSSSRLRSTTATDTENTPDAANPTAPSSSFKFPSPLDVNKAPLRSLVPPEFLAPYQWGTSTSHVPDEHGKIQIEPGQRVVILGDVHGDLSALQKFLQTAQVLDEDGITWTGQSTILVSLGDILDRGNQELACLELLASLSRQAADQEGAVYMLWGNHESLNAAGLFQYAYEQGNAEYETIVGQELDSLFQSKLWRVQFAGNEPARWAASEPGGLLSECVLQHCPVALQVGRTVCVHAGLTQGHLDRYGGIAGMNQQARDWVLQQHHGANHNLNSGDDAYKTVDDVINAAQTRAKAAAFSMPECLGGGSGAESAPVWMRDYSSPAMLPPKNPNAQAMIDQVLSTLTADRLIMGHTPQQSINCALNGKAWRVDVGASRGVANGTPQALEIIHGNEQDTLHVLQENGTRRPAHECMVHSMDDFF